MNSETTGQLATYSGSLVACTAATPAYDYESKILLTISMIGAFISVCGLLWTVYDGNRRYKLTLAQLEIERLKNTALRPVTVMPESPPGE